MSIKEIDGVGYLIVEGEFYVPDWEIIDINPPSNTTMEDFISHLYAVNEQLVGVAESKGKEYGMEQDALTTLKRVAAAWQDTPSATALKLALKHYMSLLHDGDSLTPDQRREKLNDIHVYIELSEFARREG